MKKLLKGYQAFRKKYAHGNRSVMKLLSHYGQKPNVMMVACCDSRVDPALILQCDPGDLFVVRNVANIIPPFEKDVGHHGTSAALEFGICYLKVRHLIILVHSQCGGIQALLNEYQLHTDDFISNWVSVIKPHEHHENADELAQVALHQSHANLLGFPWIKDSVEKGALVIHRWFFDISLGQVFCYSDDSKKFEALDTLFQ